MKYKQGFFLRITRLFFVWRLILANMSLFPWPKSKMPKVLLNSGYNRTTHLAYWRIGWYISLTGIVTAGFYAPYFADQLIISQWPNLSAYKEYIVICLTLLGGILFQYLYVFILAQGYIILSRKSFSPSIEGEGLISLAISVLHYFFVSYVLPVIYAFLIFYFALLCPLAISIWLIYWYINHFAPHHDLVGTGIVGATFLKVFLTFFPGLVKSLIGGYLIAWVLRKFRGEEEPQGGEEEPQQ